MAYTTIVTGTSISSSWANADVRDQTVVPFASTGARSSAITSPVIGQCSTLTTNNALEGLYIHNSAGSWTAPWNMAWGLVGEYSPADFTFSSSVGQSATFSPTLVDNRYYQFLVKAELRNGSVTGVVDTFSLYDSTAAASVADLRVWTPGGANYQDMFVCATVLDAPAAGARAYRVRSISSSSATSQNVVNIKVWVFDIGPSGAPT